MLEGHIKVEQQPRHPSTLNYSMEPFLVNNPCLNVLQSERRRAGYPHAQLCFNPFDDSKG